MRLFFALETPGDLAMQIADWRDRTLAEAGRPVPPANFHITLAFLGEIKSPDVDLLTDRVDAWLADHSPIAGQLGLDQLGFWPRPGILWLGPKDWPEELNLLAGKLKQLSTRRGGRRDRNAFRPHVTLFRGCRDAPPAPSTLPVFRFRYEHFTLFESRQGKNGVSYHPVADWPLQ